MTPDQKMMVRKGRLIVGPKWLRQGVRNQPQKNKVTVIKVLSLRACQVPTHAALPEVGAATAIQEVQVAPLLVSQEREDVQQ